MKVFHASWSAPETIFYEMLWKKTFTARLALENQSENLLDVIVFTSRKKKIMCEAVRT